MRDYFSDIKLGQWVAFILFVILTSGSFGFGYSDVKAEIEKAVTSIESHKDLDRRDSRLLRTELRRRNDKLDSRHKETRKILRQILRQVKRR